MGWQRASFKRGEFLGRYVQRGSFAMSQKNADPKHVGPKPTVAGQVSILHAAGALELRGLPPVEKWGEDARKWKRLAEWRGATRRVERVLGVVVSHLRGR